jgi:RimJ/RimL family protein N-acetyltransferase
MPSESEMGVVTLRPSLPADAPVFFEIESDPRSRRMAAFGGEDADSQAAFQSRWERMLRDRTVLARTVLWNGHVVGSVTQFTLFHKPSVAYWIDREFWGRGIATRAVTAFLRETPVRPLYARVAQDNLASQRVLEKCGFTRCGVDRGFARFRGAEVDEIVYQLRGE